MALYEYRCLECRKPFGVERPMGNIGIVNCQECGSEKVSRIWNAVILSGGSTPDVGQGAPRSSKSSGGGCGSCSSTSCGTCH